MKKWFILFVLLFCLSGCVNNQSLKITYDGQPLHIAIIGETPDIQNKHISFEKISLDDLHNKSNTLASEFDAIMITPNMFVDASQDQYSSAYHYAELPIIFWNSSKQHYPFINNKLNYLNENDVTLNNSPHSMDLEPSHSTIFLYDVESEIENTWFFQLDDNNDFEKLYTEIFNKINELGM